MKQIKWDIDEAEAIYWIAPEAAYSFTDEMSKIFGIAFNRNVAIYDKSGVFKWCTLSDELTEVGNKCVDKFKDPCFRKKVIQGMHCNKVNLNQKIEEWRGRDMSSLSELFSFLTYFTQCYRRNFEYGGFIEPFDGVFPNMFKNSVKKFDLSSDEYLDLIVIPDTSFLCTEEQKLIKLAIKQKNGENIDQELQDHHEKYEWIATGHAGKKQIDISYFQKKISELKNLQKSLRHLETFEEKTRKKNHAVIKKYKFDGGVMLLKQIMDEVGPLHDVRKETFAKSVYYADDVREEIGKKTGYSLEELQLFELKELLLLKKGKKLDRKEIERRSQYIVLDVDHAKNIFHTYSGEDAKQIIDKEFTFEYGDVDVLHGSCASIGKTRGKVVLVFKRDDFVKVEVGNILVTGMTRPEMMPVMKKVTAIVTDEGGVTCHAAIVSRELGIPCVIGTKFATKILKDGDLVEVDADSGVVRKI